MDINRSNRTYRTKCILWAIPLALLMTSIGSAQVELVDKISLVGGFREAESFEGNWYILDTPDLLKSSRNGVLDSTTLDLPFGSIQLLVQDNLAIIRFWEHDVHFYDLSDSWPPPLLSQLHFVDEVRYISTYDTLLAVTLENDGYQFYSLTDPHDIALTGSISWLEPDEEETFAYRSLEWNGEYMVAGRTSRYFNHSEGWMDLQDQIICYQIGENGSLTFVDSLHTANDKLDLVDDRLLVWNQSIYQIESEGGFTELLMIPSHTGQMAVFDSSLYVSATDSTRVARFLRQYRFQSGEPIVLQNEIDLDPGLYLSLAIDDSSIFCGGSQSATIFSRDQTSGVVGDSIGALQGGQRSVNVSLSGNRFIYMSDDASLTTGLFDETGIGELVRLQNDSLRGFVELRESLLITDLSGPGLGWWNVTENAVQLVRRFGTTALDVIIADQVVWTLNYQHVIQAYSRTNGSLLASLEAQNVTLQYIDLIDMTLFCMYTGFNGNGFLRWNVANPAEPVELPGLSFSGPTGEFNVLQGGEHFVLRTEQAVSLNQIGTDGSTWEIWALAFQGSYVRDMEKIEDRLLAFIVNGGSETPGGRLYVYDIQAQGNPTQVTNFPLASPVSSISSSGQYLMTAEGRRLRLFDLAGALDTPETENNLPRGFTVFTPWPNPFNASVTIPFFLPQSGDVGVKVYNLLGQEVWGRQMGAMPSGWHRTVWDADGSGASSGVYILRLEAEGKQEMRRVTLVH